MIALSRRARSEIAALRIHFVRRERPEAILNLLATLRQASDRIETRRGLFYPAPRPYPWLVAPGVTWLKQGRYWIAFNDAPGKLTIISVMYESADLPNRI